MTELCLYQIIHCRCRDMLYITFRAIKHTWRAYAECPNTGSPARALPGLIFALTFWVCNAWCHTVTPTVGQNFGLDASCNPHPSTQVLDSKFYTDNKTVSERRIGGKGTKLHTREGSTESCSIYRILYGWEKSRHCVSHYD